MIREDINKIINETIEKLGYDKVDFSLKHPEVSTHGDYATNVALILAKNSDISPKEIAEEIKDNINSDLPKNIEKVDVAGVGFINFYLTKEFFNQSIREIIKKGSHFGKAKNLEGKEILFEYTDPNPFKVFHIGHLMSNAIGEALSRLAESQGANVKRICYQGDQGLHVAKTVWGMIKSKDFFPQDGDSLTDKTKFAGDAYVAGNAAYEDDEGAQKEIKEINKKIFDGSYKDDEDLLVSYKKGREWSLAHFEEIYKKLGTKFDKYIYESEVNDLGKEIVLKNVGKVFEKTEQEGSEAIIFKGEDHGLHTRVFLTSEGIPPYEAKELALFLKKNEIFPDHDTSVVITANEISEYFKVIKKVLTILYPKDAVKLLHIAHGFLRLTEGKMSSRKGNIITGESLILDTEEEVMEKIAERELSPPEKREVAESVAIAAIKYSILRQSPGKDIIFDKEKSLSFEGDSGPYLQYSLTRIYSLLRKAKEEEVSLSEELPETWETSSLEKILYIYPEILERAYEEKAPQILAEYLVRVSSALNTFYGEGKIVDKESKESSYKLSIVKAFSIVLESGLGTLGIRSLQKM